MSVVNQGDFLTQLSNVRGYSNSITNRFAANYGKITNWVLAGANVNELAQYGINPQIMKGFDGYQNVLMTGYYSPVIHARRTAQGKYHTQFMQCQVINVIAVRKFTMVHWQEKA